MANKPESTGTTKVGTQRSGFAALPSATKALIIVVTIAAATMAVVARPRFSHEDWLWFCLIGALSGCYSLMTRRLERIRRALGEGLVPDLHGAWVVVGAVVLPTTLVALLTVALFAAELPVRRLEHRTGSSRRQPAYKLVYTIAAVALPAELAHLLGLRLHGLALVLVVSATIVIINNGLIIAAITSSGQRQKIGLFTDSVTRQLVDVLSTVVGASLGALAIGTGGHFSSSLYVVAALPALIGLQYVSILLEARQPSVLDPDTDLLSASRLAELAQIELATGRRCSVIVVQIIGDSDVHIRAAAGVIRACVQPNSGQDRLIGRCDAATFAIVLPGIRPEFGAWYRTQLHDELDAVGLPHLVALGYPVDQSESFHSIVMRVGARLIASLPPSPVRAES